MIPVSSIISAGMSILDKVIPDPEARDKAKLELVKQSQRGELNELKVAMSAIVAEANSKDKWTSRARPSFLYTMYILILTCIPMGVIFAIRPEIATAVTLGVQNWLHAIPDEMWTLFGVGYLGYVGGRSYDKAKHLNLK